MSRVPFSALPDEARVWVFGVGRPLSGDEAGGFLQRVDRFLESWSAHGVELQCARDWRHGRFLLVGVDEDAEAPSGCSIDAMVNVLKSEETRLDTTIVDSGRVWYLTGSDVRCVNRAAFARLANANEVGSGTTVFDNTVTRVGEVRDGRWERPAAESWHGRVFFREAAGRDV